MWLLKLHFAISVLCLLTFVGFKHVGKDIIKQNGWVDDTKKKKSILAYWIFFVPILNFLVLIMEFFMLGMKKGEFDKMYDEMKNKDSEEK